MALLEAALLDYFLRDVAVQDRQWGVILCIENPHLLSVLSFFIFSQNFQDGLDLMCTSPEHQLTILEWKKCVWKKPNVW